MSQPTNNNNNSNQGQTPTASPMAIGGPSKCNIHAPFETFNSVKAFNDHCLKYPDDHYVYGTKKCEDCDTVLALNKVPFSKITANGLDLKVRCTKCNTHAQGQQEALKAGHIVELPNNNKQQ